MFDGLDDAYPLTPLQQGMLYEVLKKPESDIYVAYVLIDITGSFDKELLNRAWYNTMQQYETLRTRFIWEGLDEPLQLVNSHVELNWIECGRPAGDTISDEASTEEVVEYWLSVERATRLSLTQSPPSRLRLIRADENHHTLIWTVHHLLADDWSTPLVLKSVARYYAEGATQFPVESHSQSREALTYSTYVDWLSGAVDARHLAWWTQRLAAAEVTPIRIEQTDSVQRSRSSGTGHQRIEKTLDIEQSQAVTQLSRRTGCTQSSIMHAAWSLVVARYAGSANALFGTSASGRSCALPGIEEAVGLFLNTLPTHVIIEPGVVVEDFLTSVQQQLFEQIEYEHVPLSALLKLGPPTLNSSLFDSVLVVETHGAELCVDVIDSKVEFLNIRYITDSNFPLTALVFPGKHLQLHLLGAPELFSLKVLDEMCSEFLAVIADLCQDDLVTVSDLLNRQTQRIKSKYPQAAAVKSAPYSYIDEWIYNASRYPDNDIAVIDNGNEYTYAQLFEKAGSIASLIQTHRCCGVYIGIYLDRGFNQVAAILGVLSSGNAYVPLEKDWPEDRIQKIMKDASISLLLADQNNGETFHSDETHVFSVDDINQRPNGEINIALSDCLRNDLDAAYMIYTSGSTGEPKGVSISHRNLTYSTAARLSFYEDKPKCYLLLSTFSFDSSVAGVFWTLCSGGTLVLPGSDRAQDVHTLEHQIAQYSVTHTLCLPSVYELVLRYADVEKLRSLKLVIVAGEACPSALPKQHASLMPHARLFNEYGPTEGTVWSTVAELTQHGDREASYVPIGSAIPGSSVQIVDCYGAVCPPGVCGELWIEGPGVADGYHRNVTLTEQKFLKSDTVSSASSTSNRRSGYKTGDQAVLGTDGQLYFLGRSDRQLKVRGHRVEAGEIESRVLRHTKVGEALCFQQNDAGSGSGNQGGKHLVCFYTIDAPTEESSDDCIRLDDSALSDMLTDVEEKAIRCIADELPSHFRVARFCAVTTFPRLPNGKVNLAGFPQLAVVRNSKDNRSAENTFSTESDNTVLKLCGTLSELLGLAQVIPSDNFFALGGDSLVAIRFVAACREQGVLLNIPMISESSTMAELGTAIESSNTKALVVSDTLSFGSTPLTPIQRWFMGTRQPCPSHWNMAFTIDLAIEAPVRLVSDAIVSTLQDYPVLSSQFDESLGSHSQVVLIERPETYNAIHYLDVGAEPIIDRLESLQADFDLKAGQLARFVVVRSKEGRCRTIGVVIHHLVTDAISNWLISRHIVQQLDSQASSDGLSIVPVSYRDWSLRLAQPIQTTTQRGRTSEPAAKSVEWLAAHTATFQWAIDRSVLTDLVSICAESTVELHEQLLYFVLQAASTDQKIRIDVETHGRDLLDSAVDVSGSVGWFTSFFPLEYRPSDIDDNLTFSRSFKQQKRTNEHLFIMDSELYFGGGSSETSKGEFPTILYNFLATNVAISDSATFKLTPLLDKCFRHSMSTTSHSIEVLVLDSDDGISIQWNIDESIVESLDIEAWVNRVGIAIESLVRNKDTVSSVQVSEQFPDSGMSDEDLAHLFS